jgi:hypothetical protein
MSNIYKGQPIAGSRRTMLDALRDLFGTQVGVRNIQPRTIRAFGRLKNNESTINIFFQDNKPVLPGESLLQDSRFFFLNSASIGIAMVPAIISATGEATALKSGNRRVVTYPYYSLLTTPSVNGTDNTVVHEGIHNFYNSHLSLKVDQFDYLEGTPLSKFMVCPRDKTDMVHFGHHQVDLGLTVSMQGNKEQRMIISMAPDGDYSNIASIGNNLKLFVEVELEGYEIICTDNAVFAKVSQMIANS